MATQECLMLVERSYGSCFQILSFQIESLEAPLSLVDLSPHLNQLSYRCITGYVLEHKLKLAKN